MFLTPKEAEQGTERVVLIEAGFDRRGYRNSNSGRGRPRNANQSVFGKGRSEIYIHQDRNNRPDKLLEGDQQYVTTKKDHSDRRIGYRPQGGCESTAHGYEYAEITIIQKDPDLSMASCGYPYYVGGFFDDRNMLLTTPAGVVRSKILYQCKGYCCKN